MFLTALAITKYIVLFLVLLSFQFKMVGLEDYLHEREENEREKHRKMFENNPTVLKDAERILDLEIEVKY